MSAPARPPNPYGGRAAILLALAAGLLLPLSARGDSLSLEREIAVICGAVFAVSHAEGGRRAEGRCANGAERVLMQELPGGLVLEVEGAQAGSEAGRKVLAAAIRALLPEKAWGLALYYIETRRQRALSPLPTEQRFGDYVVTVSAHENGMVRTRLAPHSSRQQGAR